MGTRSEVIAILAKKFNQSKISNPSRVRRATQTKAKFNNQDPSRDRDLTRSNTTTEVKKKYKVQKPQIYHRKYISIYTKRSLFAKAHHQCQYQDPKTHQRCGSKYQLEIDHKQPLALGGTNEIANLRILCRTHNGLAARKAGLRWRTH
jgi:5-methylcytosine-specific restriction endonuclease McrA